MVVNNPKKEYTIPKSIDECFNAALKLSTLKKYKLTKNDTMLREIQYHVFSGIRAGFFLNFTFSKISDTETKVVIEASAVVGAVSNQLEMGAAQKLIDEIASAFSQALKGVPFHQFLLKEPKTGKKKTKGIMQFFYIVGLIGLAAIGLYIIAVIGHSLKH